MTDDAYGSAIDSPSISGRAGSRGDARAGFHHGGFGAGIGALRAAGLGGSFRGAGLGTTRVTGIGGLRISGLDKAGHVCAAGQRSTVGRGVVGRNRERRYGLGLGLGVCYGLGGFGHD